MPIKKPNTRITHRRQRLFQKKIFYNEFSRLNKRHIDGIHPMKTGNFPFPDTATH